MRRRILGEPSPRAADTLPDGERSTAGDKPLGFGPASQQGVRIADYRFDCVAPYPSLSPSAYRVDCATLHPSRTHRSFTTSPLGEASLHDQAPLLLCYHTLRLLCDVAKPLEDITCTRDHAQRLRLELKPPAFASEDISDTGQLHHIIATYRLSHAFHRGESIFRPCRVGADTLTHWRVTVHTPQ